MKLPPLSLFVLDTADEYPTAFLGDVELDIIDINEDGQVVAECDYAALTRASLDTFPDALCIKIHSPDGFGTFLFHEAEISKGDGGTLVADYICIQPNKYWEGTWGLATFLQSISPLYAAQCEGVAANVA